MTAALDAQVVEDFWAAEMIVGYDDALTAIAEKHCLTREQVEKLVTEDDEANNGNI